MIDIESAVYTRVRDGVRSVCPQATVSGIYTESPSSFPFVSFVEASNSVYNESQTLGSIENHASVMYQADIYSNETATSKSTCKWIANAIDEVMINLGFVRVTLMQTPNVDRSIYRITARYEGVVSKGVQVGDNIQYSIYSS